jgi:hypothetical protein
MACRVYRNIKLLDLEDITLHPLSDLNFAVPEPALNSTSDNTRYSTSSARIQRVDVSNPVDVLTLGKSRDIVTQGSGESGILKPDYLNSTSSETREL